MVLTSELMKLMEEGKVTLDCRRRLALPLATETEQKLEALPQEGHRMGAAEE